ncbi:MAG: Cobyrinic acid ac-diamide synthase [Parcubacteria group bacterium GW2011_GWA2_36_10]|nr:MAG: Cobyrinic acid ac-diamide synthase [Parcubacteria group bacterium GW2011_GWA2_36_10]
MHDSRNKLSQAVFEEIYRHFPHKIFRSVIPRNVKLAEAPSFGKTIRDYDQGSPGARAYRRLSQEIIIS